MNYNLPLNYYLKMKDLDNYNEIEENKIKINNFNLYVNNDGYIYKITSNLELKYLMDFMNNYDNIVIRKIYYFLIIKFLLNLRIKIEKEWEIIPKCFQKIHEYDIIIPNRSYYLNYNNKIVITEIIKFNICLIINNRSYNKSFIGLIDNNCDTNCLYEILNELTEDNRFSDIIITIIGGSIDNIDKLIKIYLILKKKRIAKFITKTHLLENKELNRIKYDMNKNKIKFINDNKKYNYLNYTNRDNLDICFSGLYNIN